MNYENLNFILSTGKRAFEWDDMFGKTIHLLKNETFLKLQKPKFTPEELKEIAEYMIELWKEWAK